MTRNEATNIVYFVRALTHQLSERSLNRVQVEKRNWQRRLSTTLTAVVRIISSQRGMTIILEQDTMLENAVHKIVTLIV
jgi:hypothetical protein